MPGDALTRTARLASASGDAPPDTVAHEVIRLFGELRIPLLRHLHTLGLPLAEGEDIVQDAFAALYRHLCAGMPRDNLRAWLYRVTRNLALKQRQRSNHASPITGYDLDSADPAANPELLALHNERHRTVAAVLAALPSVDRQCLQLRAQGLRYREIASVLGISLGSVAGSLVRSLERIGRARQTEK